MDSILGQSRAIDVLQAALASGRLHHAYVFHGPWGVGKFTTAVGFAQILLCHNVEKDLAGRTVACGACPSCARFSVHDQAGAADHPDLHVIRKELAAFHEDKQIRDRKLMTIPVEILRSSLIEPAYRAPQLGRSKVFIVDEAELMAPAGQNALLKTLEEPPAGTYLILVTRSEDKLLVTIRSRCQRIAFLPLPDGVVDDWLAEHAGELSVEDRSWLSHFAGGSLGQAQLAVEYGLAEWSHVVLPALEGMTRGKFPDELGTQMAKLIDDFAKAWVDAHKNASKEAANKQAAGLMWTVISQHARRQMRRAANDATAGDLPGAEAVLEPWAGVIDALGQAEAHLASNVNISLVCDHLSMTMHRSLAALRAQAAR